MTPPCGDPRFGRQPHHRCPLRRSTSKRRGGPFAVARSTNVGWLRWVLRPLFPMSGRAEGGEHGVGNLEPGALSPLITVGINLGSATIRQIDNLSRGTDLAGARWPWRSLGGACGGLKQQAGEDGPSSAGGR